MRSLETRKEGFVKRVTEEVVKLISKNEKISLKQALSDFRKSRTFNYLVYSNEPFTEEGPDDFFEMYENDKKYGELLTDVGVKVWKQKVK